MKHRERVIKSLNHEEPDRIPIDFGSTRVTSIVKEGYQKLRSYLGKKDKYKVKFLGKAPQVVEVEEDILKQFDVDLRGISLGKPDKGGDIELDKNTYKDEWGVVRTKPGGSFYYELKEKAPLAGKITASDIINYNWPDPQDPGRTRGLKQKVKQIRKEAEYAIILDLRGPFVHTSQYLRGFEDWYIDCALNPKILGTLFDAILDVQLAICKDVLRKVGNTVDIIRTGDDLAAQNGLLISPESFRKLIKPRLKKFFQCIHEHSKAKVFFHTCGSVQAILKDLVEIGVDILNPVQVSAVNMDTKQLKKQYGDCLTFWGAIDTQRVLPYGNINEVREEVKHRIADLAPGGGYILCAVHNIQPDVPPENIVAMYDYAKKFGVYPILF